ncbi:FUSC family protein [Streptomyces sp. WAC06614]|uniref:FUSC family protein n=1 Tax=Streptomyces sp. WAC06614 TaxID=2487416 RepID=UPI000F7ADAC7|nr:FUSC family protein [Streptomyces sp. WAC06614]RSS62695.1 FUSC family protein [Streptomyces sp. WAC06614]
MGGVPRTRSPRALRLPPAYAAAARRSLRVTLAAGAGFYLFLYGFGSTTAATYALFGAVSLAGLSRIPGTGQQRAATLVRVLPVGWLLIVAGTFLAVRTWSAVVGMLVIGFVLAFVAVSGPRPAGAAPGLQLLYILPCFPPYDPGSLDERLLGATVGILLLVLAEYFLFRDPPTLPYEELVARAAGTARRCVRELTTAPYRLTGPTRQEAGAAAVGLRPMSVAEAERPAGPGVRERALAQTGLGTRTLLARLTQLNAAPPVRGPAPERPGPDLDVLRAVERTAAETAARLRRTTNAREAQQDLLRARTALAATRDEPPDRVPLLRRDAAVLEIADAALAMSTAADLFVRGRAAVPDPPPARFWYARTSAPQLWWRRLAGHAERRSVYFQNAVRISLALAAARLVAGLDTLPHGFWAMLATLTLTRTTVRETRTTIRVALTGTLVGALVTAGLLALVSTHTTVYALALLPVMLVTFTLGPVKGVGWAQALFTLTVALVFAQLAHATWQLAELRLLDVLIGSAIGAVFGLLAWPRGGQDELRRSAAVLLRGAAEIVVATAESIAVGGQRRTQGPPGNRSLQHALILTESAYAQFQSEPAEPAEGPGAERDRPVIDWQAVVMAGHHTLWGSDRLLAPRPGGAAAPALGAAAAAAVTRLGDRVAGRMLLVSAALDPGGDTPEAPVPLRDPTFDGFEAEPDGAPRLYYATAMWLDSLMTDLERISAAGRGP